MLVTSKTIRGILREEPDQNHQMSVFREFLITVYRVVPRFRGLRVAQGLLLGGKREDGGELTSKGTNERRATRTRQLAWKARAVEELRYGSIPDQEALFQ